MSDQTVSFSKLASESLIEVGAGRPRSVLDQYPSIPILRVADVLDGRIESPSQDRIPDNCQKVIGSKISKPGDVVLTAKGTVGRVALMPSDGPSFAYSPQLCYFRPTVSGPLRSRYLYYWFVTGQVHLSAWRLGRPGMGGDRLPGLSVDSELWQDGTAPIRRAGRF